MEIKPIPLSRELLGESAISVKEDKIRKYYNTIFSTGAVIEAELYDLIDSHENFYNEVEGLSKTDFNIGRNILEEKIKTIYNKFKLLSFELEDYTNKTLKVNDEANILAGGKIK